MYTHYRLLVIGLFMFTIAFSGCKKDDDDNTNNNGTATYFIEGKVDGVLVRAEATRTIGGAFLADNSYDVESDWTQMHRAISSTSDIGWEFFFMDANLDTITYPVTMSAAVNTKYSVEAFYYHFDDNRDDFYSTLGQPYDGFEFNVTLTGFNNDVLEGTFEGTMEINYSSSGDFVTVTEGKFKIKMVRI